ncbi:hypothetical protein FRC11_007590 [Ceratobasidium sp. 423]|nr:hypothetical protein FRC11_007590 [Ceratobasidium sp. 423]
MHEAILDVEDLTVVIGDSEDFDEGYLQAIEDLNAAHLPPRTQRCFLVATPGQRFTIHYHWSGQRRTGNKRQAGLFCELYMDGLIVERAFLPLKAGTGERGNIQREWQIPGRYFCASDGSPRQLPFRFGERVINPNAANGPEAGTIRVVLYWAHQNRNVPNLFPSPTEALAQEIAMTLRTPADTGGPKMCVDLRDPEPSDVVENDLRVKRVDNLDYTFIFVYSDLDFVTNAVPVQAGEPAL